MILVAAAVAAMLALGACGGDDDGGSDDEGDIADVIRRSATESAPENCTELQTQAFTEQTEFSTGEEAITACEEDGDDTAGESVEVDNIEVDGDTATAETSFTGGGLDGQTLGLSLVKEDDQWKLDSLDEFVDFDKATFTAALVEDAGSDGDAPPEVLTCVEQQLGAASDEDIQTAFLSGDEQQLVDLFGTCFQ